MQPISFTPTNQFNQGQVDQANQAYQNQIPGVQQAQQNLQNYQQGMQDPGQMYSQNLQKAQGQFGFDPAELKQAQQALAGTQTTMANLPQATQQQANGRMLTGAQEAGRYAQQAGNMQNVLAGQGNATNALQNVYQNTLSQANQQTGFGVQGQQMQLGALQNVFSDAANQRDSALQQLQNLQSLFQKQGQFNADELAQYQQANAAMQSSQAAMEQANAQMGQLKLAQQASDAALAQVTQNKSQNMNAQGKAIFPTLNFAPQPSSLQFSPTGFQSFANNIGSGIGNGVLSLLGQR